MSNRRNISLDIIRIVAVLAVVMIHASADFVTCYDIGSTEFMWGNILDSISRIGVPLFVMVSGSLMLDEEKSISIKRILSHNIGNILFLLIFWSGFYSLWFSIAFPQIKGEALNLRGALSAFINGHYHLWYLFMMIGLYLITPFLKEFVRKENKQLVAFFILIALATQFTVPVLREVAIVWDDADFIIQYIDNFQLGFFGGYTAYYLIGWYIVHVGINKKYMFYILGAFSLITTIIYVQLTQDESNGYSNQNIFILFYAVAVFILLNCIPSMKVSERARRIITLFSKLTFGVYVIHPFYLKLLNPILVYNGRPFAYIFGVFLICSVLSFVSCLIGSKVPVIKKLFRM